MHRLMVVLGLPIIAGLGLPRWVLGFPIKRRQNKFLDEFPNALDVIVRSIKSGLPLNDASSLPIVALISSNGLTS